MFAVLCLNVLHVQSRQFQLDVSVRLAVRPVFPQQIWGLLWPAAEGITSDVQTRCWQMFAVTPQTYTQMRSESISYIQTQLTVALLFGVLRLETQYQVRETCSPIHNLTYEHHHWNSTVMCVIEMSLGPFTRWVTIIVYLTINYK